MVSVILPQGVVFVTGLGAIAYGIYNLTFTRRIFQDSMYETVILIKSIFL